MSEPLDAGLFNQEPKPRTDNRVWLSTIAATILFVGFALLHFIGGMNEAIMIVGIAAVAVPFLAYAGGKLLNTVAVVLAVLMAALLVILGWEKYGGDPILYIVFPAIAVFLTVIDVLRPR